MLALRIIELLNDDAIVAKLKTALYPCDLADKIDSLNSHIENLTKQVKAKDIHIVELEKKIHALEESSDNLEQYTRRPNLRIHGVPETGQGKDTNATVLAVIDDKMGVTPPLSLHDLERSVPAVDPLSSDFELNIFRITCIAPSSHRRNVTPNNKTHKSS